MRVVFLDFDGVLHPSGGPAGQVLPFEWVPLLATLLAPFSDVYVVVHSTWREQFSVDYLQDFLEPLQHQFLGAVAAGPKGEAIQQFLDDHPEVSDALILDDDAATLCEVERATLVVCDPRLGVSSPDLQLRLLAWLKGTAELPAEEACDDRPQRPTPTS